MSGRRDPRARKGPLLDRLRSLLDVAGAETPWEDIDHELRSQVSVHVLAALVYRVERARSESFEEGEVFGGAIGPSHL